MNQLLNAQVSSDQLTIGTEIKRDYSEKISGRRPNVKIIPKRPIMLLSGVYEYSKPTLMEQLTYCGRVYRCLFHHHVTVTEPSLHPHKVSHLQGFMIKWLSSSL